MLAAAPLLLLRLQFPLASRPWQDALNGLWDTAQLFLYESGNDPHRIAVRARLVPIFLTILLGLTLFVWTKTFVRTTAALFTLFVFVFCPTVLAHGRLVTTDIAAAFGVALAGFSFIHFLRAPRSKTALLCGLSLGTALLFKFSTILLLPFLAALTLLWMILEPKHIRRYAGGLAIIGISAAVLVLLPYLWIVSKYPPERQLWDTYYTFFHVENGPAGHTGHETAEEYFALLGNDRGRDLRACATLHLEQNLSRLKRCPIELAVFVADKPLLRAWGQYLFGVLWVMHQVRTGGTADFPLFFLGEVSTTGWWSYFPIVYAIKEPLPWHLLAAFSLFLALRRVWSNPWGPRAMVNWIRSHPAEVVMIGWLVLYWSVAIGANLNIGVRHLLPVFPFTTIFVAREIGQWLHGSQHTWLRPTIAQGLKGTAIFLLLTWQCVSVLRVYPSFLTYFNEGVGGPKGGADYVVDSSLDWGQDLRRLRGFVAAHHLEKIAVDYFGTASPRDELGEKFIPWRSAFGPYEGWFAVSVAILKMAQGRWDPALGHTAEDSYEWLQGKEPVAKIGYSILVFDLRTMQPP